MPINITDNEGNSVAFICDDDWGLPSLVYELEEWLKNNYNTLKKGQYVADIGYVRNKEAGGGGGVLTIECMKMLTSIGMEIWLSEYPTN